MCAVEHRERLALEPRRARCLPGPRLLKEQDPAPGGREPESMLYMSLAGLRSRPQSQVPEQWSDFCLEGWGWDQMKLHS